MQFDNYLATYLYENKSLTLNGMGTFTLEGNVNAASAPEKGVYYPIDGLSFVYNPKKETEDNVIIFLQKNLGKIQSLVRSDLESYLANIKQFINLGKPYTIEGIGTLRSNNKGEYEFTPGNFLPAKEELNPRRENEEHNYPVKTKSSAGRVFVIVLIVVAGLAALGGIGWGVSNLFATQQHVSPADETEAEGYVDTVEAEPAAQDTANHSAAVDTISKVIRPASTKDTVWYKMWFETTRWKERAVARINQLHTLHSYVKYDTIHVRDSTRYRLYLPMRITASDTVRVKDSLEIFFGNRVRIIKY